MSQEIFNKDINDEDMEYIGDSKKDIRFSDVGIKKWKDSSHENFIDNLTFDERFINALLSNENFIQGIKNITGGNN